MMSVRSFFRVAAAAVALLAPPPAARAECVTATGDWDMNGLPDIRFMGTIESDALTVDIGPASTRVTGCGTRTFETPFSTYGFFTKGKDDTTINIVGAWVGIHRNIQVQLGLGANRVTINGTGALTAGSSLLIELDAMAGADAISVAVPAMDDSCLDVRVKLDPGDDAFLVKLDKPITGGSVVNLHAILGGEANRFELVQTGLVDAVVNVWVEGGPEVDTGALALAGPVGPHGRLCCRSDLGAGDDAHDGRVDLSSFRIAAGGEVRVDVTGGPGADTLTLSRKGTAGGGGAMLAGLLDVSFDGAAGDDAIGVDLAGGGFALDGTLRLREDGGAGNDRLDALLDVAAASAAPVLDALLHGGGGSDTLTAAINNAGPNAPSNYGPARTAILDGGLDGGDRCVASGNGIVHARNGEP